MFEMLTNFIEKIKEDSIGEWVSYDYPEYFIGVKLCAFTANEMKSAQTVMEEIEIEV